ncbi:MAG: alpha-isopropylmalate synthase regulatory domain-containing protein [Nanoarchaeota archaeon]|nr:alpha-isopropylmalate synthase regulatory domain-containing protein [Nanoarchaeota archaeon]
MLEIYDCTLREGEQAHGVSFSLEDRIELCKRLDEFGVDFIELGWPLTSKEILSSFKYAIKAVKNAKIVAFGSTSIKSDPAQDDNLNTILECGAKYACIFGKTLPEHIEKQLKISKEDNLKKIKQSIEYLKENGITVFYDAEHYFDAFKIDKNYAISTLLASLDAGAERIILCDTKGGILPDEARSIMKETYDELSRSGKVFSLGAHYHNDCGIALANTLASLDYIIQVQGTINGIGERVGNLNFSEFLPVYIKKLNGKSRIDLKKLKEMNETAYRISGIAIPESRPFIGDLAFSHKGGVHIDAETKGASYNHEDPRDFGNKSIFVLNSLGGRNSVVKIAEDFGYRLNKNDPETKEKIERLFKDLRKHEQAGYQLGHLRAEQYLLLRKHLGTDEHLFDIKAWNSESRKDITGKERARFYCVCNVNGILIDHELSVEGGPVEACFNTLKEILSKDHPEASELRLYDFSVRIAREREEESTVRTEIWFKNSEEFSTVGVDRNIIGSAVEAIAKGFRYHILRAQSGLKT